MKCGSCRIGNAASYKKIVEGHHLFETLKNLHPERVYNDKHSYFCGLCLDTATKKLQTNSSELSDQNANSLSVRNASFTANTHSSRNEYDLLVAPQIVNSDTGSPQFARPTRNNRIGTEIKRKTTSDSSKRQDRPCPKRFKNQFKGKSNTSQIRENDNPESVGQVTSSQNSETVSEYDVLLNIQQDNADSVSSGEKATSSDSVEPSRTVAIVGPVQSSHIIEAASDDVVFENADSLSSGEIATSCASVESSRTVATVIQIASSHSSVVSSRQVATVTRPNVINDGEQGVEAQIDSIQNSSIVSESNLPLSTLQQNLLIAGPSAPASRNPRIRQQNDHLLRDGLRRYFDENVQEVDVNNYSRLTAG